MALRYPATFGSLAPRGIAPARLGVSGDVRGLPESFGYRGRYSGAGSFGAESFTQQGVECGVDEIIARNGPDPWREFCDCSFSTPTKLPVWKYNGLPLPVLPGQSWDDPTWVKTVVANIPSFDPAKLALGSMDLTVTNDDWQRCMSKWCGAPTGCWSPSKNLTEPNSSSWDGFNVHPGILAAPWTEFGAAARGIPKRNAGFWYGVASITTIDIKSYEPIRLYVTMLTNPARFAVLRGFASVFTGSAAEVYFATLQTSAVAQVAVLVTTEGGREYAMKNLILPLAQFGFTIIGVFLALFGGGIPAAVAMVIKYQAQQVFNSGRQPADPGPALAVLMAIASYGDQLADFFNPSKWAEGGTWRKLGSLIRLVAKEGRLTGPVADGFNVIGLTLQTIGGTVQNIQEGKPLSKTLDLICVDFFGFTATQFQAHAAQGTLAKLVKDSNTDPLMVRLFTFVAPAMEGVITALTFFADALAWLGHIFGGWDLMDGLAKSLRDIRQFIREMEKIQAATAPDALAAVSKAVDDAKRAADAKYAADAIAASPYAQSTANSRTFTAQGASQMLSAQGIPLAATTTKRTTVRVAEPGGAGGLILAGAAAWLLL